MKKLIANNKSTIELFGIILMLLAVYGAITLKFSFNVLLILVFILFAAFVFIIFKNEKLYKNLIENFFKFRWLIYLIVFIICILFKLHGSSIGVYNTYFKEKIDSRENSTLLGVPRMIRSDEFNVLTPYYISQTYNDFNKNSDMMSLTPQNMIIGYNAPVKDITILAKPLDWGYMLLGKDYGLSWYWCMKTLLLFAFALECMLIFTKNKELSIIGAFLVAFGPATLWWFAPHMPDVILWAMAILSTMYYYLSTEKRWLKNILMVIIPFIISEFVIALFPSFQVGLGIFAFVMLIMLIIRDKIQLFKCGKQNLRHVVLIILTMSLVGYFIVTNKEALLATMNTAYPGNRISTGGNGTFASLFTNLATIFLPYKSIQFSNESEMSTYIHFGFFIFLLFPSLFKIMKKNKDRNLLIGVAILIILLIYGMFVVVGFPAWLAKITLFSRINRMGMVFGLISVFFTIWGFNAIIKYRDKINPIYYFICAVVFCMINVLFIDINLRQYIAWPLYIIEILAFFIILVGIYIKWEKSALLILMGLLIFGTITINPIVTGTSDIYNHPSAKKIQEISNKNKNAYWVGYNSLVSQNYIIMNGGKSLFAVNFYPDKKKWEILDPEGKNEEFYNRYSNFIVTFTEHEGDEILITNPQADLVKVELNLKNFVDIKAKYIMSQIELDRENDDYKLSKIYEDGDCKIYEIIKK